jgi:Xaa-Pro aminopeptidase
MVGIDGAIDKYEADKAFALPEMGRELGKMLHGLERVFVLGGRYSPDFLEATKPFHKLFYSGDFVVEQLRLFKSSYELERMKFASKIGCNAFKNMMSVARPGMTEIALASEFESSCKREGALWTSFPCVVAGGSNAAVVHYLTKRQLLKKEELVLVDAGCEVAGGYVSDITRTWPVDGKFTAAQRTLYELTLDVQKKCLEHLQSKLSAKEPLTLDELHDFSVQILMDGMRSLGILKLGPYAKQHDAIREFMKYNPTHIGHYLGMDVHDTSQISRAVPLTEGMVITVEPGIYIPRSDTSVPKEFQGIGIRIEDDVIVSNEKHAKGSLFTY